MQPQAGTARTFVLLLGAIHTSELEVQSDLNVNVQMRTVIDPRSI